MAEARAWSGIGWPDDPAGEERERVSGDRRAGGAHAARAQGPRRGQPGGIGWPDAPWMESGTAEENEMSGGWTDEASVVSQETPARPWARPADEVPGAAQARVAESYTDSGNAPGVGAPDAAAEYTDGQSAGDPAGESVGGSDGDSTASAPEEPHDATEDATDAVPEPRRHENDEPAGIESDGVESGSVESGSVESERVESSWVESGGAGSAGPDVSDDEAGYAADIDAPTAVETPPTGGPLLGETLPRPDHTRVMVVANQKGGVGKTTTSVNMAAALAGYGARVLVVDVDPQGNASTALGIDHHEEVTGVYEVLIGETTIDAVVQEAADLPSLHGVPATIKLAGAEIELVSLVARESRLKRPLDAYLSACEERGERYDYVFIDCPPSLGLLTLNALVAAREALIPIQCEYYALEGVSQLLRTIELVRGQLNPELMVSTVLLTMYDGRTRLAAGVADEVRGHFGERVLRTAVPRSVRISEAPSYGQTVITHDPTSSGALSYIEAAREFALHGRRTNSPEEAAEQSVEHTEASAESSDGSSGGSAGGSAGGPVDGSTELVGGDPQPSTP